LVGSFVHVFERRTAKVVMNEGSRKSVAGSNCVNDLGLEAGMGMSERRAKENASVLAARHAEKL
jgi:hypothetical protein